MTRRASGHTLVEILVAVLILALLAGIVLPSGGVGDVRKLDTVQLEIQDAIDHAQSLSYQKGAPHGVRFNTNHGWFAVVNEVGVAVDDPLSHGDYVVRLKDPGQPTNVFIDHAMFAGRPLVCFDTKGVLVEPGTIRLRTGETERWLSCNTATAKLIEIPVGTE
jgi:type II secretory pathway pseudopilin PulG